MFGLNVNEVFNFFTTSPDLSLAESVMPAFISFSDTKIFLMEALMPKKLRCAPSKFGYGFSKSLSMARAPLLIVISSALILSVLGFVAGVFTSLVFLGCNAGITFITKEG